MSSNIKEIDINGRRDLCPSPTENLWYFIDPIYPVLNCKPRSEKTVVNKYSDTTYMAPPKRRYQTDYQEVVLLLLLFLFSLITIF